MRVTFLLGTGILMDKLEIPAKVPDYIFSFPGNYGGTNMGIPLHKDELRGVVKGNGWRRV